MASDVETPRYEAEVDDNIAQVSQKIRLADLGRGALALSCLLFGYALIVSVLDLSMGGSDAWGPLAIRLVFFTAFVIGVGVLGARVVLRYLTSVNPYYAARRLEETIPGSKNSLINWLDLKDKPLPPVIHQAVGMRAARDVAEADADLVTSSRDLWKLGATTGILFVGLIILFAMVPRQFGSLFLRAAMPFRMDALGAGTTIVILKPGVGDVVVPANQRVEFLARIDGRCPPANSPGAPALLYRYTTNDIPVRVPLEEDNNGQWGIRLSPDQLRTGLYWKFSAGDASTPEAQLRVRAQPFVTRFEATYIYRPYRGLTPSVVTMPNEQMPQPRLFGHRGTDVVLKARANAPIKSGTLELDLQGIKKTIAAELPVSEPQTLVFRFGLEKSGTFRIFFEAPDGERNLDRSPYAIDVMEDGAPFVDLVKPGKDLVAPANGTVLLAGVAHDDFGVTALQLQLTVGQAASLPSPKGPPAPQPLAPQPYMPKTKLRLDNGTYPLEVLYVDVLALDQLRTPDGKLFVLNAGHEVTYWLEATDNNDFGRPSVGKSKSFKITIEDGLKPATEQKKERREAQQQKEQHDQNQSDERDKQNNDQGQKEGKDKDGKGPGKSDGGAKSGNDPNPNGKDNQPKNNDASKGNAGANNQPSPEQQKQTDLQNQLTQTADKVNDALEKSNPDKQNPSDPSKGQNGNDTNQGGKNPSNPKSGQDQPPKQENANGGPNKDDPSKSEPDKKDDPGAKKGEEKKGGADSGGGAADNQKGEGKGEANKSAGGGKESAKSDKADSNDPKMKGTDKGNDPNGAAKTTEKTGKPDLVEKGKTPENGKTGAPTEKSSGTPTPGQAKGNEGKESPNGAAKAESKKGDEGKSDAKAKGDGGKSGEPEPVKNLPPNQSPKEASLGKSDGGNETNNPPTKEDIETLKNLLKKGGPEADAAAKNMAKRGQDLNDPGLKKDLENVLKDAGRENELKELNGANPETAPLPQKVGDGGKDGPGAAAKEGPPKNPGNEPSPITGPGGRGLFEELKKITPEEAFARRMGNLQLDNLEELKKRIGPDVLKEAKVSDAEWQRFLENAQKLQEIKNQIRDREGVKYLKGGASKIVGQGPRRVQTNPDAKLNPTAGAQAVPPPEFSESQRIFLQKK